MISRLGIRIFAGTAVLASGAGFWLIELSGEGRQQFYECLYTDNSSPADLVAIACTAEIQSGRWLGRQLAIVYNKRGEAYYNNARSGCDEMDNYKCALSDYEQAIHLYPEYVVAYNNRGLAHKAKGDYDGAIVDYDEAIRRYPKLAELHDSHDLAYGNWGDYDRAAANNADISEATRVYPKLAELYDNRGAAYNAKGVHDRAIADYDEAIAINPEYVHAYDDRALAYENFGDYDGAIANYSEAIRLDPKLPELYDNRGVAYENKGVAYEDKGDLNRAIADYSEAIKLKQTDYLAYLNRGLAYLYAGSLSKALADFNQASELNPGYAYTALWLEIASKRSNLPSRLFEVTKQIDMTVWPAPIIKLYVGKLPAEAVLAAADDPKIDTRTKQVCEADFFIGEFLLQQSNKDEAVRLFRLAATDCPKSIFEWPAAKAELKTLGVTP
jgi:tetratricopeptide (TPR) repeat protein